MRQFLLSLTIICALGFLSLTLLVKKDVLRQLDFNLTVKLQDKISVRWDNKLVNIVDLGSMEIQTVLIAIALFFVPISKKVKLLIAATYICGLFTILLGKSFLPQPAPAFFLQRGASGFSFPSSLVQIDASYPSGHTYRVMFLASLLSGTYIVSKKKPPIHLGFSLVSIGFASLVMIGLVLLGKHWTSDVLGGIFLSVGLVSSCLLLSQRLSRNSR